MQYTPTVRIVTNVVCFIILRFYEVKDYQNVQRSTSTLKEIEEARRICMASCWFWPFTLIFLVIAGVCFCFEKIFNYLADSLYNFFSKFIK